MPNEESQFPWSRFGFIWEIFVIFYFLIWLCLFGEKYIIPMVCDVKRIWLIILWRQGLWSYLLLLVHKTVWLVCHYQVSFGHTNLWPLRPIVLLLFISFFPFYLAIFWCDGGGVTMRVEEQWRNHFFGSCNWICVVYTLYAVNHIHVLII